MCWCQLLPCQDVLLFFVIYDSKWRVFGFWTVGCHFGLLEFVTSIFHKFYPHWGCYVFACDCWFVGWFVGRITQKLHDISPQRLRLRVAPCHQSRSCIYLSLTLWHSAFFSLFLLIAQGIMYGFWWKQPGIIRWLVSTNEYRFDPGKNLDLADLHMKHVFQVFTAAQTNQAVWRCLITTCIISHFMDNVINPKMILQTTWCWK